VSLARRYKWEQLLHLLRGHGRILVAFSGGADSTLVLAAAREALGPSNVLAVTAVSPSLPAKEKNFTQELARQLGVSYHMLFTEELKNPSYASNPSNRCFFCKDELYFKLSPLALQKNMSIADGFNISDRKEDRPGVQAARKWNITHPLEEAGLEKRDIRVLSRWKRLPTWNKPASPCLSSRIPFGQWVTDHKLRQIEGAEEVVHAEGFRVVRVRHYEDEARVEVPLAELPKLLEPERWERITGGIKRYGFVHVNADSRGFESGRLNQMAKEL
jgi:pyridinium-3,5-biscarboxylic acid mononucleotide sulfurtransferase